MNKAVYFKICEFALKTITAMKRYVVYVPNTICPGRTEWKREISISKRFIVNGGYIASSSIPCVKMLEFYSKNCRLKRIKPTIAPIDIIYVFLFAPIVSK